MADRRIPIPPFPLPTPRKSLTIGFSKGKSLVTAKIISSNIHYQAGDNPDAVSAYLGTPVYSQFVIKKNIDTVIGPDQTGDDYAKFDSVICVVNQSRNIVTTPIQGRNGTVKEYISDGDYDINIKGHVIGPASNKSPKEEMENIINLFQQPNELVMISSFLTLFGIQYVVVNNYSFSQVEGTLNQVQIDIKMLSDEPIEVKLGIDPDA